MRALALTSVAAALAACGPSSNAGDCSDSLIAGDLVITEVFADSKAPPGGSGTDEGKEWFELYNAADRPVELKGLTITHSRPDGTKAKSHVMDDITIAPGQFLTLGNSAADLLAPYIDYGYSADLGDFFNTDGGKLALTCGKGEIDSATYEGVKEGHSRQLTAAQPPDYTLNDDQLNWCQANDSEFDVGNFGTPGSDSDCTPVVIGQCNDGGAMRDSVAPMPGDLVITEVMPNPGAVSDTEGEWFEIYAVNGFDLNGVGLDRAGDTANPNVLAAADCIHMNPGSYGIFVKNADMAMNGGLPAAAIRGTFTFSLVDGSAAAPGDVRIMSGTNVVDAITWTSTRSAKSHSLDPDSLDAAVNDIESNFCDGAMAFGGGDMGTPGTANAQCPIGPSPGMCDPGSGTLRPIVKPAAGQLVITEFLANPANVTGFTDAQREWFEIKNTGATAFDLNDLTVASASSMTAVTSTLCKSVAPGAHALFARSNDPSVNAMLPEVDATFSFSLVDSGTMLAPARIEVRDGATVLDLINYTSVSSGNALQLDPDHNNPTDNDTAAVTAGVYCLATVAYGEMSNKGTPKAANAQCP